MMRDVAVDLHRKTLFVVIVDADGTELLVRRFPATVAGEAELLQHLQPGDRVVVEATGGAHRFANRMESGGAVVVIADPQQTRLVGLRGKKTDYRDCRALLTHLQSGVLATIWRPDRTTREIRQLTRERAAYNQSIVRLKNRIKALLWEEGLELATAAWEDLPSAWLAEQPLPEATRRILEREWAGLQALTALKARQDQELAAHAQTTADAQRLMQVPGFGAAMAVMFLGEVGDAKRFPTAKQLVSYAGLDPRVHQSDERSHHGTVSKGGRSQLRWLMVEVAWAHVAAGGPEAGIYHRLVKQGKPKGVAIVALARRLLILAYCLLCREENYRGLDVARYEGKLTRLAARRPEGEGAEESNVDWAARRLKEMTGKESPYRQAHPRSRPGRRPQREGKVEERGSRGETVATAGARRDEFPALEGATLRRGELRLGAVEELSGSLRQSSENALTEAAT
jgi:transposase